MKHAPQLDGIRGAAIAVTVAVHAMPNLSRDPHAGVHVFFVLSAFLITSILLERRAAAGPGGLGREWRAFYWRRALRIFPAYYLTIAALWIIGVQEIRDRAPIHAAYLTNIVMAVRARPDVGNIFWSLCVEEHFYVVWPVVVLWLPKGAVTAIAATMIAIGPASRLACAYAQNVEAFYYFDPSVLDLLGAGALAALYPRAALRLAPMLLLAGAALRDCGGRLFLASSTAFAGAAVVRLAAEGRLPMLERAPLRALGRISYGVYLFHVFVMHAVRDLLGLDSGLRLFVVTAAASVALAALSWRFVEAPILSRWRRA